MVTFSNSIIATNIDNGNEAADCAGTLMSQGYVLLQVTSGCALTGVNTGQITGQNPLLGPLSNQHGDTLAHSLLTGSPALNSGNPAAPGSSATACALLDQRGVVRPMGAKCDMGALEQVFFTFLPILAKGS